MVYRGTVKNGVVVFENGSPPDGTLVRIEPVMPFCEKTATPQPASARPAIWDKLLALAGTVEGLPPDASSNLDHYLYGHPKIDE